MKWIKIKRDEDGFATESCLDIMFASLPIVLAEQRPDGSIWYEALCELNCIEGWRGEIDRNIGYTHYLPIKKIKL